MMGDMTEMFGQLSVNGNGTVRLQIMLRKNVLSVPDFGRNISCSDIILAPRLADIVIRLYIHTYSPTSDGLYSHEEGNE